MKRLYLIRKGFLACLLMSAILASIPSRAETGAPTGASDNAQFVYGARIDPWGQQVETALSASAEAGLDWISVDFDWERHWPGMGTSMNLVELDRLMSFASKHGLHVLVSISNAPDWALTDQGPDAELTAGLVAQLTRLYPETLLAVELFPSANTARGWGAPPNPKAYSELLKLTANKLEKAGRVTLLVAAGLEPIPSGTGDPDMDDLDFLQQLYAAGGANYFSAIGIRIPQTDQEPLAPPWKSDPRVLRHYESVRSVMLKNHHNRGNIWITGFSMPSIEPTSAGVSETDQSKTNMNVQVRWLNQAMQLARSQLYIGAVFYACMNPPAETSPKPEKSVCLIQAGERTPRMHPGYQSLEEIVSLDKSNDLGQVLQGQTIPEYRPINQTKAGAP